MVHPTLPNYDTKPDFLVTRNSEGAYVECKAVLERTRSTNEAAILNCTNKASHPDFILELDIDQEGTRQPSVAQIRTPIEKWLRRLNADDVIADRDAGKPLPTLPLEIDDWQLLYTAHPVPPEQRGKYSRLLGLHSSRVVMYDNVGLIKRAVRDKGRKYTDVDTPLDHPLIVALNTATVFIDDDEIDAALFGSGSMLYNPGGEEKYVPIGRLRNGYWCADPRAGTRVVCRADGPQHRPVRSRQRHSTHVDQPVGPNADFRNIRARDKQPPRRRTSPQNRRQPCNPRAVRPSLRLAAGR